MAQTSLIIGDTNWAVKEDSLLGYNVIQNKYLPIPIDCVRATTATRVNEQVLIEVVPRNLVRYSEQFENATWTKLELTIATNNINSPTGTLTANKIIPSVVSGQHILRVQSAPMNLILGVSIATYSIYAKQGEYYNFRLGTSASAVIGATFNLSNGTISNNTAVSASIQDVGNGWYRCIVRGLVGSVLDSLILDNSGNEFFAGNAVNGLFLWGAQIEEISTATEYFPTTNRLDIPRIDYSTGAASLLVEPQRTNLLIGSNAFVGVGWTISGTATITSNFAISPDGTQNAAKLTAATQGTSGIYQLIVGTASVNYSRSIYMKSVSGNTETIRITDPWGTGSDGILVTINGQWNRYTLTSPLALGVNGGIWINNIPTAGIYIYGSQLEAGSYATSYIPTIASTVTRNADVISRTGISSLIGQTEGTIFLDYNLTNFSNQEVFINPAYTNSIALGFLTDGTFKFRCLIFSNSISTTLSSTTITTLGNYKIAVKYKSGENKLFINGILIATDTSALNFTALLSDLFLNRVGAVFYGDNAKSLKNVLIFKTALTDTELQSLTTL